ncbi:MAG TPA: cobalt-precorrin-6A reductase [Paracoccus solventivorans]|uniref:cobalt-precorrin-6A reductase n=1 Tax=Paracoccus solventivorans TaxID=53463 RepID=UPI002C8953AB|nr:cobalt-precorrin-6A reductase [Paracoccus solventivorans]HMM10048.1 cobalt-precorrin-6A reductase [Paracoccus solventivorans]
MRVLLLGGTTEAAAMARALAEAGVEALYSYAGRTSAPRPQPLPLRIGGFGGAEGLAACLHEGGFTHVIDATHPFAASISRNAVAACAAAGVPLLALERPAWAQAAGDDWTPVPDLAAAAAALPRMPANVFLAIGRQNLDVFAGLPHRWLLRFVDPEPVPLPRASRVVDRGPFTPAGDMALMRDHRIQIVVAKNAGGEGARAKLDAARALRLPVVMVARPAIPARETVASVAQAMAWLHRTPPAERGV